MTTSPSESAGAIAPGPRLSEGRLNPPFQVQKLEQQSDAQLDTCGRLVAVLQKATEALNSCGVALQREVTSSLPPLSSSFTSEPGGSHDSEELSRSILVACENLGAVLLTIAAVLTGDLLTPLVELRRTVHQERQDLKQELERLEQREVMCCEAMAESISRKEKVSGELQERLQQSQAKKGDRSRMVRWILKKSSKAEGKLQAAAHAQTAAVEELAGRLDQLALVQTQRQDAAEAFSALLRRLTQRRQQLLRASLGRCAAAFGEGAACLQLAFGEAAAASSPSSPSSPAKARASVPPLRLAELPLEEEVHVMNTDSMATPSGSSMGGEILNCDSDSDAAGESCDVAVDLKSPGRSSGLRQAASAASASGALRGC